MTELDDVELGGLIALVEEIHVPKSQAQLGFEESEAIHLRVLESQIDVIAVKAVSTELVLFARIYRPTKARPQAASSPSSPRAVSGGTEPA